MFMGDQQIAGSGFRTFEPASPWLPLLLFDCFEQGYVLLSARRKQNPVLLQQAPIFHQSSLDVGGCGFVHPDVEKNGSLSRRLHGRYGWIRIVSDASPGIDGGRP